MCEPPKWDIQEEARFLLVTLPGRSSFVKQTSQRWFIPRTVVVGRSLQNGCEW